MTSKQNTDQTTTPATDATGPLPPRPAAFDDLLALDNPITPQREDREAKIRRIRAEIAAGTYLTEERLRVTIDRLWQDVSEKPE